MKELLQKRKYIIIIFLLLGPILDVASFYGTSISIIIRGIYLVTIILLLLKSKRNTMWLILLIIFSVISFSYQSLYLKYSIFSNLSLVLKFLYLPCSILYFKEYLFPIKKDRVLTYILLTYTGLFIVSYIFKIGASAYLLTDGKMGFKGLFSSMNEFSAIIVGLLPIVTTYLKNNKKYLLLVLAIITSLICGLLTGTKVLLAGIIFTVIYLLYQEKEKLFFSKNLKQKIIIFSSIVILLFGGVFLFTKTRTYKNMIIQKDFFNVDNVLSIEYVNKVIYNDRLSFLNDNYDYFKTQDLSKKLLGIGNNDIKMVEIDIFDIIFRYGIIGFLLFIISVFKNLNFNKLKQVEKVSLILLFIASLTSGHVLIYPAVCIYIGILTAKNMIE